MTQKDLLLRILEKKMENGFEDDPDLKDILVNLSPSFPSYRYQHDKSNLLSLYMQVKAWIYHSQDSSE